MSHSPIVERDSRFQPGSEGAATRSGCSTATYFSGWITCSVDAGGRKRIAASTTFQPPPPISSSRFTNRSPPV